jgi:hypothetical protein
MKRPLALLVAAVIVTLAGSGCGGGNPALSSNLNDAATLSYTLAGSKHVRHISRDRLLSEVRNIINNKPFAIFLKEQKFEVSRDVRADARITAIWLSQLIQGEAIDALLDSRHVKVSPAIRSHAATNVVKAFPSPDIFPAFSAKFRATLTDRQARTEALLASYVDTSDAAAAAYFRAHESQFGCPSGKEVAHILVATRAAAQGILDQLRAGGSFAELAKQSTDPSGAQGGRLGCLTPNKFTEAFQRAAEAAPLGTPVGPVQTQYGYHVILATKAAAPSYAAARTQVLQAMQEEGTQNAATAIRALMKRLNVHLDRRFGTWGPVPNGQGQSIYEVTPPTPPKPRSTRESTTTTVPNAPTAPNGSP